MAWVIGGANYDRQIDLTVDSDTYISGDLTNQVVMVHLDNGETDFWTNGPPVAGGGVRFGNADGSVIYDFEVESYDTTGDDGWWHVEIPTLLSASDTEFYIFYDVDSETDGSVPADTWESNYIRVHHANEDASGGAFVDSTGGGNLTNGGTTSRSTRIDKGRDFDGSNDSMTGAAGGWSSALHGASGYTFEVTTEIDTLDTVAQRFANMIIDSIGSAGFLARILGTSDVLTWLARSQVADSAQVVSTVETMSTGVVYHLVFVADIANDTMSIIRDGVALIDEQAVTFGSSTYVDGGSQTDNDLIGDNSAGTNSLDGYEDEVTISKVARSLDWAKAKHQSGLGTWLTVGTMSIDNRIDAGVDALTLTEYPATVSLGVVVAAGVDALTLTEYAAAISLGVVVAAGVDALTLTEYSAAISLGVDIAASTDALTLTEYPAAVSLGVLIAADVDALTLTEYAATISAANNIAASTDALVITEYQAAVSLGVVIAAGVDALTLTEYLATIQLNKDISTTTDALVLTEYSASILSTVGVIANRYVPKVVRSNPGTNDPRKVVH